MATSISEQKFNWVKLFFAFALVPSKHLVVHTRMYLRHWQFRVLRVFLYYGKEIFKEQYEFYRFGMKRPSFAILEYILESNDIAK